MGYSATLSITPRTWRQKTEQDTKDELESISNKTAVC
jgi:hypothetical protein